MLSAIRTFRNTDGAALCKVWNAHYGDLGFECRMTALQLELLCLAKPYFLAEDLLVAEHDEQVVGFLHLGPMVAEDLRQTRDDIAVIAALCIVPCDGEDAVAQALLKRAEKLVRGRQVSLLRFKPLFPESPFYQGLGPADSMIGATTSERRSCGWLKSAGFAPALATSQWQLDLGNFQAPIDRLQIQIRRGSQVERDLDETRLPWWQACLLGHAEPVSYSLLNRSQGRQVCEALIWTVASELQTSPDKLAWLWPIKIPAIELGAEQLTFLLGEICRQLQSERIDQVRSISSASDTHVNSLLRRLGFSAEQSGVVFEKKLF